MTNNYVIRQINYAAGQVMRWHEHAFANVTLVLRGGLRESVRRRSGDEEIDAAACSVVIKPAFVTHQDVVGPAGCATRTVEFAAADTLSLPSGKSLAYGWHHGGPVAAAAIELFSADDNASAGLAFAQLIESAAGSQLDDRVASPALATRTREVLHVRLCEPIRSSDLADELGVHPVYLARAFRRRYGVTMHRYVARQRVRRGAERLASSRDSVATIALQLGFADQAHFCRAFRTELRTTPSAYRALAC